MKCCFYCHATVCTCFCVCVYVCMSWTSLPVCEKRGAFPINITTGHFTKADIIASEWNWRVGLRSQRSWPLDETENMSH